jgi:predicted  nucleic acid-binding Zn-ribbon protein
MSDEKDRIVAVCVRCSGRFTDSEIEGETACPGCGNTGVPMTPDDDVQVAINWHELRILCIWAENWAAKAKRDGADTTDMIGAVFAIADRLQRQHPTRVPLTLSGEIEQLKESYTVEAFGIEGGGPMPPKLH